MDAARSAVGTRAVRRGRKVMPVLNRHVAVACVVAGMVACSSKPQEAAPDVPMPPRHYAGNADGLHDLWMDIVTAARRDDRDKVHELMVSMVMTDDDLKELFGPELAAYFKPRYEPMIGRIVHAGSLELVSNILDRRYDDVDVFEMRPDAPELDTRAALRALVKPVPVYAVRVKQKGDNRGLRYDFFVYRGDAKRGRWVTGNQLGKFIAPPPDVTNTTTGFVMPKPVPAGAAAGVPGDKKAASGAPGDGKPGPGAAGDGKLGAGPSGEGKPGASAGKSSPPAGAPRPEVGSGAPRRKRPGRRPLRPTERLMNGAPPRPGPRPGA